ncbi:unnamed protein product [Sphagnum balticum]
MIMRFTLVLYSQQSCRLQFAVLISGLLSLSPLAAFADESHLQAGINLFNAHKLQRALGEFRLAESEKPNDPLTQYYLGVTLVKCNQFKKARPYFESAGKLAAPNSDVARLSTAALQAFGPAESAASSAAKAAAPGASGVAKTASGQLIPSLSIDGGAGSGGNGLTDNFDPAVNTSGQRRSSGQIWNAPPAGSSAGRGASLSISGSSSALTHYSSSDPAASQALRLIGNQAQSGIASSLGLNSWRYSPRSSDNGYSGQQHASALKTSADNLSSQLVNDHLTGSGIRLVPEGTSLHVRNYESFHSDDDDRANVVPMEAKSLSLKDFAQTKSSSPKGLGSKSSNKDQTN